jgi:hypothetical protein
VDYVDVGLPPDGLAGALATCEAVAFCGLHLARPRPRPLRPLVDDPTPTAASPSGCVNDRRGPGEIGDRTRFGSGPHIHGCIRHGDVLRTLVRRCDPALMRARVRDVPVRRTFRASTDTSDSSPGAGAVRNASVNRHSRATGRRPASIKADCYAREMGNELWPAAAAVRRNEPSRRHPELSLRRALHG